MSESENTTDDEARPPRWQRALPTVKWMAIGLFIYGSVYVLGEAKNFLVPIVLGFLLSMVFAPIRRFFDRRGIPSVLSSLAIVVILLCSLFVLVSALALPATDWIENAPKIQKQVQNKLTAISGPLDSLYQANERLKSLTGSSSSDVEQVQLAQTDTVTKTAKSAPTVLAQIVFTLVLLLFLLASGDMFYEKIVHVMPTLRDKRRAVHIVHNIERKLSRYLFTITVINASLGGVIALEMWLFGMPSPMVFGVVAFLFNFIPYLGAIGGILIAGAVALVSFDWIGWSIVIPGIYFVLNSIEGQFITPYFVGRSLRLNTVMVFISISFWAWLWSAIGMIVAVPLLIAVKTFAEHIDSMHSLGDFLSERHAELEDESETNGEHSERA